MKKFPNRYPGSRPFSVDESELFFGRDDDVSRLTNEIVLNKHIVLHGKSGLGKSSLVSAGLIPSLKKSNQFLSIQVRFGHNSINSDNPLKHFIESINQQIDKPFNEDLFCKLDELKDSLWYALKRLQLSLIDSKGILCIFDQFEELFSYTEADIDNFKSSLAEVLFSPIPIHVKNYVYDKIISDPTFFNDEELELIFKQIDSRLLFIVRSDSLSKLDNLTDSFPVLLKYLYELKALNPEQCIDAIVEPAKIDSNLFESNSPKFIFSKDAVEHILNGLSNSRKSGQKQIATNQLQWVLQHCEKIIILESRAGNSVLKITPEKIGKIDDIIENFFNSILAELGNEKDNAEKLLQDYFIVDDSRVSVSDVQINARIRAGAITENAFNMLLQAHLLRAEPNSVGGISYELSHDTLVEPIKKARIIRLEKQLKIKQEKERAELIKKNRTKSIVIAVMILAFAIIGALATWLFFSNETAKKANTSLEKEKKEKKEFEDSTKAKEFLDMAIRLKDLGREEYVMPLLDSVLVYDKSNSVAKKMKKELNDK